MYHRSVSYTHLDVYKRQDTNRVETNIYPFAKTDEGKELCGMVSKTIKEMKADGTLKKLSEKWFDTDITVQPENTEVLELSLIHI